MIRWAGKALLALLLAALSAPAPAWAEYRAKGKRDPLIPLLNAEGQRIYPPGYDEEVATGIQGLVLQGIVFDPQSDSYAILNGQLVREKDEIEGMQVLEIGPRAITIQAGGQKHELVIQEPPAEDGQATPKETHQP